MIDFLTASWMNWLCVFGASIGLISLLHLGLKRVTKNDAAMTGFVFVVFSWLIFLGSIGAAMTGWD